MSKWIPVEERLPEREEEVLVCNEYGDYWLSYIKDDCEDVPHWFNTDDSDSPTHWMPLPEPPEMKGENNG